MASTYSYTGLSDGAASAVAQANMLNEGIDLIPSIANGNVQAIRDAILAEVAASLSGSGADTFTTLSGNILMGASPPASGAIRIDGNSYSGVAFMARHAAAGASIQLNVANAYTQITSSAQMYITVAAQDKWLFVNAAGDSTIKALAANCKIIGGATNGFAIRNSGDTRDNFAVADAGTSALLSNGTNTGGLYIGTASGELAAGFAIYGTSATANTVLGTNAPGTAGIKAQIAYYNATQWYSALEVANVASGFGTLALMKSGGKVAIGTAITAPTALGVQLATTASSGAAYGFYSVSNLSAAANNDSLYQARIEPVFTPGAFTGLTARGLFISAFSTAAFTTPADPAGLEIGVVTGTGATNAYGLRIAPPTGATNNYLIAHTTPATFNVKADGTITSAAAIVSGTSINAGSTGLLYWASRSTMGSPADGHIKLANNAGTAFSDLYYGQQGGATTSHRLQKAIASIADNTATTVFTVTVPNAAHAASISVKLVGIKGAGDAEGAAGSAQSITYDCIIQRTAGVTTTAVLSSAYGSAVSTIGAGNAVAVTGTVTAMTGAVDAQQTFNIQVTVARTGGSSTNHTCVAIAEILNANATGVSIA